MNAPAPRREHASTVHAATAAGLVDLTAPDPATITPAAMAASLSKLNRWAGNTELPISVAQHCVLVMEIFVRRHTVLRPFAIHALLHDGHEYLLGDLTAPFEKQLALRIPGFRRHVEATKNGIDSAIRCAWTLPEPTIDIRALVHEADLIAASIEWRSLIAAANGHNPYPPPPRGLPTGVKPLSWDRAETLFRDALERELAMKAWEIVPASREPLRETTANKGVSS